MMIVDTNVNLSRWPFRRTPCDTLKTLTERMKQHDVATAWTGSMDGIFHRDVDSVNQRLADQCKQYPQLIPFGTVNPTLPDWEEDLRRCFDEYGMPGIRLHPNYHGYAMDDMRFHRLLSIAAHRNRVVQLSIRMDDIRVQHHLMQVPDVDVAKLPDVVSKVSGLRLMLIGALRVLGKADVRRMVSAGNVHVEISMLEGIDPINGLLEDVPLDRIHFGSHLPLFNLESALLKLKESDLTQHQWTAICHDNSLQLLGSTDSSSVGCVMK